MEKFLIGTVKVRVKVTFRVFVTRSRFLNQQKFYTSTLRFKF